MSQSNAGNAVPNPTVTSPAATPSKLTEEIALCLSGGGYRAMLFHMGALLRLNDAGLLRKLGRVSSVSGGSITAGVLALRWKDLAFDKNGIAQRLDLVLEDVQCMARVTVDAGAIVRGLLLPGTISDRVSEAYDQQLFHGATLQDLPDPATGAPCFVLNATNVQTGDLWRFTRAFMGDYQVGLCDNPNVTLAKAVAASSAFPPVLSPATITVNQPFRAVSGATLNRVPFTTNVTLSDGGVYDNLGLENPWKDSRTILVSDGGQKIAPEEQPAHDWARHAIRVLDIIDNQVRSLRKRDLIASYIRQDHNGTYWGIRSSFSKYPLAAGANDPLGRAGRDPSALAAIATRLEALSDDVQKKLMNWGYAICDAAIVSHWVPALQQRYGPIRPTSAFPFANGY